jgi:hypothetical protein
MELFSLIISLAAELAKLARVSWFSESLLPGWHCKWLDNLCESGSS